MRRAALSAAPVAGQWMPPAAGLMRALVTLLLLPAVAFADSWIPPSPKVVSSPDTRVLARITPGRQGTPARVVLYRFDAGHERYAFHAGWNLPQRRFPVDVLVTDAAHLVVLDEWGQMGKGQVLTIFSANGKQRFAFTLKQLLGKRAAGAPASVSSVWWRCGEPMLVAGGAELRVVTYDEGELIVNLVDGQVSHEPGQGRCR